MFLLEICSWTKVKAEELKDEFNSLRNYVLNLDPEKSLTLVLYREFQQLKKKEEHDYVSKDTLIKFMQTLSGKNLRLSINQRTVTEISITLKCISSLSVYALLLS